MELAGIVMNNDNDDDDMLIVIEADGDVNVTDEFGRTALWHASYGGGQVQYITALLDAKANIDKADASGYTPLHIASCNGCVEKTRILIQRKANVNALSENLCTPLHYASYTGELACAQMLVKAGAEVDRINNTDCTPFAWSLLRGNFDVAEFLLHSGAKMSNVHCHNDIFETTPINRMIRKRRHAMYSTLVVKGLLKRRLGLSRDATNLLGFYFWNLRLK